MPDNEQKALEFFGLAGFEFWTLGGNLTAYGRNIDNSDAFVLITDEAGEVHPISDETVLVGFYPNDEDSGVCEYAPNFKAAVETANRLIAKHCPPEDPAEAYKTASQGA